MLRPLLFLSALIGPVARSQQADVLREFDISSCAFPYFGKSYSTVYISMTDQHFAVCFTGYYDPQSSGDCVVGPPTTSTSYSYGSRQANPGDKDKYSSGLSSISESLTCELGVRGYYGADVYLYFGKFNTEAALLISTRASGSHSFDVQIDGVTVETLNINNTGSTPETNTYLDISGCRESGVVYRPGDVISSEPSNCTKVICNQTAVITPTECGILERCPGDGNCILDPICTVTGPTIINFYGQVNSVPDRCVYILLAGYGIAIFANFPERRRKDVNFLDSLTLWTDDSVIVLKQDGRVLVDGELLTLNSSAHMVDIVEISKNETGITVKSTEYEFVTHIFFDGHKAQMSITGPAGRDPYGTGLCAYPGDVEHMKFPYIEARDCDVEHNDTVDSTIDCEDMTERCGLLNETIFSSCHSHTDPTPYITACADTLCSYPDVDGLYCQFMEAYARACSLRSNDTLDWRTETGCSSPQVFCQDRICSDHEFCAQTVGGEPACFCRAIFASPYRSTDSYGEPMVCDQTSASVTLVGCLLEEKGFDYTALHLNDETCRGETDELTHMVTFSFNSSNICGAVVTANNSQLIYKNTITSSSDVIIRNNQVNIDFSCVFAQPDIKTMSFRVRESSVVQQITSGSWNYNLTMKAYTNAGLTQAVESGTEVQLNQKVWAELDTEGLEGGLFSVVTDACWATDQESPSASPRHDLIIDGCANPADQTVEVEGNGMGTSTSFSFNMFQFPGSSGEVYLHCQVHLCAHNNETCTPVGLPNTPHTHEPAARHWRTVRTGRLLACWFTHIQ
uniref:uncharacterized protein LOC124054280 isoform X3 n=1 Tax=Scatophagus argus TaxID=75038 RepID=UPI001ED7D7BB|nr:uncharacterized protein LOC124054280 isoform X3 [Scatophagus argus]XP_046236032.1 uncharacterized protein LOC124054280 isoform X3 [Scatophagus argus]